MPQQNTSSAAIGSFWHGTSHSDLPAAGRQPASLFAGVLPGQSGAPSCAWPAPGAASARRELRRIAPRRNRSRRNTEPIALAQTRRGVLRHQSSLPAGVRTLLLPKTSSRLVGADAWVRPMLRAMAAGGALVCRGTLWHGDRPCCRDWPISV